MAKQVINLFSSFQEMFAALKDKITETTSKNHNNQRNFGNRVNTWKCKT